MEEVVEEELVRCRRRGGGSECQKFVRAQDRISASSPALVREGALTVHLGHAVVIVKSLERIHAVTHRGHPEEEDTTLGHEGLGLHC